MLIEVPAKDDIEYPTLGPWVCDFIEERFVYGPGSLQGQPVVLDVDQRRILYHAYEHFPPGFQRYGIDMSGRRRFSRVSVSVRKGSAKTELMAWIVGCELHPDGPVRFTSYDGSSYGLAQGRPVRNPYIPMLAYTKDQTEELGYGALRSILESCDDADLFDIGLKRIVRKNDYGGEDGKCVPISGAPSGADGARTTMQALDETHRLYTQQHRDAIETMINNLPKRPLEDPWQFAATTAGEPGQGSYAEDEYIEGVNNSTGKKHSENFYFFHRQASDGHKFNTMQQRMAAIHEATGPGVRKWSRLDTIAALWDREGADKQYLERVWTNRWTQTAAQAFDKDEFKALGDPSLKIPHGAFITLGFDGAKFKDSTALVATEISTGIQNVLGFWEKPEDWNETDADGKPQKWQVPEVEVNQAFTDAMANFKVWRLYGDPPHWVETMANWSAVYPDQVFEFWTKDPGRMYYATIDYQSACKSGSVAFDADPKFVEHIGNAGKRPTRGVDEEGNPKFMLAKITNDRKYDIVVAAILSWKARMDAITENAQPPQEFQELIRVR